MSEAEKKTISDAAEPSEALAHWQAQEQAGQPPNMDGPPAPDPTPGEWQMPSGWWLIPAAALGAWLWVKLLQLIL